MAPADRGGARGAARGLPLNGARGLWHDGNVEIIHPRPPRFDAAEAGDPGHLGHRLSAAGVPR